MTDTKFTPSQSQTALMVAVIQTMMTDGSLGAVKVNWETVAEQMGMAKGKSARNAWGVLRNQIEAGKTTSTSPGKSAAAKPATISKKRKTVDEDGSGEPNGDDSDCEEAPKANGVKRARRKAGNQDDGKLAKPKDEDDE